MLVAERVKGGDRRSQSRFRPINMDSQKVIDYPSSKAVSTPNPLESAGDGSFIIRSIGQDGGNYHWVTAEGVNGQRFASTVHYFSNPGPAPRKMLMQDKISLEIRPVNLPREHQQFRANESWDFQVLSKGESLANVKVVLETSNGTTVELSTNNSGIVSVPFPDDFKSQDDEHKHHAQHASANTGHRRQSAKFVLSLQHEDIITAFNYKYRPDAFNNKVVIPAIGLLFFGSLVTGILLFRRRKA